MESVVDVPSDGHLCCDIWRRRPIFNAAQDKSFETS
eukprot:14627.XXX_1234265_1233739_1 [CDS] Oithona nana genome sequencing.